MVDYTGSGHKRINKWLRRGQIPGDTSVAAAVKDIDTVLAKNKLPQTTHLTRVVSLSKAFQLTGGADLETKVAGKLRTEDGFMSTSRRPEFDMEDIADPVVLDVIAPAGTPAAAIEDISKVPRQYEILLGRDLDYVIREPWYDQNAGVWRATLRIL